MAGSRQRIVACAMALAHLGLSLHARAADPEGESSEAAPAPSGTAPDLVKLKNGGMVRGTISEMIPDEYVVIVTLTGETRRFEMTEVSFAGPVGDLPAPSPAPEKRRSRAPEDRASEQEFGSREDKDYRPEITVHAKEARLRLRSKPVGLTFYKRTSAAYAVGPGGSAAAAGFQEICTAPCEASLPAGTQSLAISEPGKLPIPAKALTLPAGKSTVKGELIDQSGWGEWRSWGSGFRSESSSG